MAIETTLSLKDAIGLAADLMTLFGLSGFFTWSFVRKSAEGRSVADVGINVFALSTKAFLSALVVLLLAVPAFFMHVFILLFARGSVSASQMFWNSSESTAYVLSYVFVSLWFIPLAILSISCVFTWSVEPFERFWLAFSKGTNEQKSGAEG